MWMNKLLKTLKDPRKLRELSKNRLIKQWTVVCAVLLLLHLLVSDGDFSVFMTISSAIQCLALVGVCAQLYSAPNLLSLPTFIIYALIFATRLTSILVYEGYLPLDSSGDWFYRLIEVISLALSVFISYKVRNNTKGLQYLVLIIPCFLLSLICHSTLNNNILTDVTYTQTFWTFSMYLEGIALYPQTFLLKSSSRDLESFSTHFVAGMLGSRICAWIFWVFSFTELNTVYAKHTLNLLESFSGYFVFIFQCLNFYLTGDFFYYYVKSAVLGSDFNLPL